MPKSQEIWWNNYKDIKHLSILHRYIDEARKKIPTVLANGKDFESATIAQLLSFAKEYNISIIPGSRKEIIIDTLRSSHQ